MLSRSSPSRSTSTKYFVQAIVFHMYYILLVIYLFLFESVSILMKKFYPLMISYITPPLYLIISDSIFKTVRQLYTVFCLMTLIIL